MRNKILLTLLFCVCASVAWAADATVVEAFGTAPTGGAKTSRFPFNGRYTTWYYNYARSKTPTDKIGSDRAFWTDHKTNSADNKDCYLETTIEGGLKAVSFKWQQGNTADHPDNLYLGIEINDVQVDFQAAASVNASIVANTYTHTFAVKENNVKFAIYNKSTTARESPSDIGRILIGPITITPYLLYTQKDVTVGLKQKGYYNDELINNTGSEGTISYSSSATGVATVDSKTGIVTPVSAGNTVITATWSEGVATTYTLHVVNSILAENFSKVKQTGQTASAEWNGDLFTWEVANVRRGIDDTLGLSPRIQATAMRSNTGSSLVSKAVVEGGVKHIDFDWRQWATATTPLTIDIYYSTNKASWGDAVATQSEDAVGAATPHNFSEDISDKTAGNAYLKLNYTSGAGVAVIGALKITPWLLYTNKTEQRMRVGDTYKRVPDIDNTGGESGTLEYISSDDDIATVASDGTVTAKAVGKVTITAKYKWTESEYITTTYPVQIWPVKCETFDEITQTGNYNNTTPRVGDKATWTTSLGGFNVGDFSAYTINLARFRAPYQDSGEEAYIESSYISGGISSLSFKWNVGGLESTTNWDIRVLINGRQVKQLLTADLTDDILADFGTVTINDIDEPGKFSIRFENHSTVSGTYTSGNKGRFVIDDVTWTSYDGPIELDETADNSAILSRNNGVKLDVDITRSSLVGGVYNTLCLPFSISKSDLGEGVDVQELTSDSLDGDVLTVGFSALVGETLTAGTPYLVKPASNVSLTSFTDKTLISMPSTINQGAISLVGIFSPYAMTGGDKTTLFVGTPDGEGNNLFYPAANGSLKGFRAYFKLNTAMSSHSTPRVARFVVNQNRVPTGIEDVNGESARGEWKKVIRNGQLFIEHDGSVYTVTGQKAE